MFKSTLLSAFFAVATSVASAQSPVGDPVGQTPVCKCDPTSTISFSDTRDQNANDGIICADGSVVITALRVLDPVKGECPKGLEVCTQRSTKNCSAKQRVMISFASGGSTCGYFTGQGGDNLPGPTAVNNTVATTLSANAECGKIGTSGANSLSVTGTLASGSSFTVTATLTVECGTCQDR